MEHKHFSLQETNAIQTHALTKTYRQQTPSTCTACLSVLYIILHFSFYIYIRLIHPWWICYRFSLGVNFAITPFLFLFRLNSSALLYDACRAKKKSFHCIIIKSPLLQMDVNIKGIRFHSLKKKKTINKTKPKVFFKNNIILLYTPLKCSYSFPQSL